MGEKIDNVILRIKRWIGTCSANTQLENLKDAVEKGKTAIRAAELSSRFVNSKSEVPEYLKKAQTGLGKISETIGKSQNICMDIKAITQIHEAIKALDQNRIIYSDPEGAAKAFGNLFAGFGRLARYLPMPAKQFAELLENCGNFFVGMAQGLRPDLRWKKKFKEIERETGRAF